MPDVTDGGGGSGAPISAATPTTLHSAGVSFRTASNACADMADNKDLQNGGAVEVFVAGLNTIDFEDGFAGHMRSIAGDFLGALISARQQLADVALDLMQCAGDFEHADRVHTTTTTVFPTNGGLTGGYQIAPAKTVTTTTRTPTALPKDAVLTGRDDDGNLWYTGDNGETYVVDKAGDVVKHNYDPGEGTAPTVHNTDPIIGQHYDPHGQR